MWPTSTYTSLMASTTPKEKHMLMFSFQAIPTNTSPSTKWNTIGHLELPMEDMQQIPEDAESLTTHSITTKRMVVKVEPDIFRPPCHKWRKDIETKLVELLKEYWSQFAHNEISIGTSLVTKMTIDTGVSEPVSQKPYPIALKYYKWVKDEINKLLTAKVIWGSQSSWSAPIIVVPKGNRGKHLLIYYSALNKITQKFIWPMPKVEDIFSNSVAQSTSQLQIYKQDITTSHWMSHQYPKQPSPHNLENMNISRCPLGLHKHLHISRNSWQVS